MLDTTRAMGASELSLSTTAFKAASPSSPSAMVQGELHGSPVESEGTEFFDAYDTLPWSPERARPSRQSPAAMAARRMQLALWPDTESAAEKLGEVLTCINHNNNGRAASGPPSPDVEGPEVGGVVGVAWYSSWYAKSDSNANSTHEHGRVCWGSWFRVETCTSFYFRLSFPRPPLPPQSPTGGRKGWKCDTLLSLGNQASGPPST